MHSDNTSLPAHCRMQAVRVCGYSGYAHQLHLAAESLRIIPICLGLAASRVLLTFYHPVSQPSSVIAVDFPAVIRLHTRPVSGTVVGINQCV